MIPDADMGMDAQGARWGVVSPKCPSGDNVRACDQCSVWGSSDHPSCPRDRQDDFEVLEESPTWVQCFVRVGCEVYWELRSLYWVP